MDELFDLEWALNARTELRQAISERILSQKLIALLESIKKLQIVALRMIGEYGDFVELRPVTVVNQLQQMLTFQGIEDIGVEYLDILAKEVYESTLTGTSFAQSVNAVKAISWCRHG